MCDPMADPQRFATTTPVAPLPDLSLSHTTQAQRVTSVLLIGKNSYVWSNSLRLFLRGKRKIGWLLGKEKEPDKSNPK